MGVVALNAHGALGLTTSFGSFDSDSTCPSLLGMNKPARAVDAIVNQHSFLESLIGHFRQNHRVYHVQKARPSDNMITTDHQTLFRPFVPYVLRRGRGGEMALKVAMNSRGMLNDTPDTWINWGAIHPMVR